MRYHLQDKVVAVWGMLPFFIFETNHYFHKSTSNRNFFELLDAFISISGRIYLGHYDFNSSLITLLTFEDSITRLCLG